MKVKLFRTNKLWELENMINGWMEDGKKEIVDTKLLTDKHDFTLVLVWYKEGEV